MIVESVVKVIMIVTFLLYAYFMIGGYTACSKNAQVYDLYNKNYDLYRNLHSDPNSHIDTTYRDRNYVDNELNKVILPSPVNINSEYENKNIYQRGPYLNF